MAESPKKLAGVRVLVVDDDPDTLDAVCFVLELQGAIVVCVDNVEAALRVCEGDGLDVIVSDLMMPGQDGFMFLGRLRALSPPQGTTPALALSAMTQGEAKERAHRAGFQAYLTKPVEPPRLVDTVARLAHTA